MGERPRSQARRSVFIGGNRCFRFGGANKAERSDALGAAVEVKPVPKTIGEDKFNLEQIRQRPAEAKRLVAGYDSSTPMPANR